MGLFSHLGDVVSGKNYKRNVLLTDNLNFILERAEKLKDHNKIGFAQVWAGACSYSANYIIDYLLFDKCDKQDEIQFLREFQKNIARLTTQSTYELFKIIACHHLLAFFENPENESYLLESS